MNKVETFVLTVCVLVFIVLCYPQKKDLCQFLYISDESVIQENEGDVSDISLGSLEKGCKSVEQENADEQYKLGVRLEKGEGVTKDLNAAIKLYRKAAELGNADAQYKLGFMYENGNGVNKDIQEAAMWYHKSAELGNADAQCMLGTMYETGKGVPKNELEAVIWYCKATKQGLEYASYLLHALYESDGDLDEGEPKAVRLCHKAAEMGDVRAQFLVGRMYENGTGVEKNLSKSFEWYRMAADKGNIDAQLALGKLYENGCIGDNAVEWNALFRSLTDVDGTGDSNADVLRNNGVRKDLEMALKYYRMAAEQGNADAQYNLGLMYERGKGVFIDIQEATNWYAKAASQGNSDAYEALVRNESSSNVSIVAECSNHSESASKQPSCQNIVNLNSELKFGYELIKWLMFSVRQTDLQREKSFQRFKGHNVVIYGIVSDISRGGFNSILVTLVVGNSGLPVIGDIRIDFNIDSSYNEEALKWNKGDVMMLRGEIGCDQYSNVKIMNAILVDNSAREQMMDSVRDFQAFSNFER